MAFKTKKECRDRLLPLWKGLVVEHRELALGRCYYCGDGNTPVSRLGTGGNGGSDAGDGSDAGSGSGASDAAAGGSGGSGTSGAGESGPSGASSASGSGDEQ